MKSLFAPFILRHKKKAKLARIRPLLKEDIAYSETPYHFNCLGEELREKYNIVESANISSHRYDPYALSLIEHYRDGLILDCGAGKPGVYYANVVNFEIAAYDTTDVIGVGEELPFKDNTFDAIFSLSVLEHVKDPFKCASEIARVMKKQAKLYCVVPFLQPLHAYPHHYYNMTHYGLKNLFDRHLRIEDQHVPAPGKPIWMLSWFLNSWLDGLSDEDRQSFSKMTVADLARDPMEYFEHNFVNRLAAEKNFELACTTTLIASKPA